MSKVYSTDLIDLIKALSSAEKGYIKKFAFRSSSKGNHLYLSLFNDIDRQKVYNENELLKNLKYARQLPQLKKYLYSAICKALDSYHAESSPRLQLIKMISMIEILFEKGLDVQCRKLLTNAKKIARANELYPLLIELLQWEKLINPTDSAKEYNKIYAEQQEHMEAFKVVCDYVCLKKELLIAIRNNFSKRITNEFPEYEFFLDHPLIKNEEIPLSWRAKNQFFESKASYYELKGDYLKSYLHQKESLLLFENFPEKKIHELRFYLPTLNNYLWILIRLKKYQEIEKHIVNFKSVQKTRLNNPRIRYGLFLLYSTMLHFYLLRGEFEKGIELIKEIEPDLKQYEGKISQEIELTLSINSAIIYFGACNFSSTLHCLNKIIMNDSFNLRNDIVCFARILNLITHFELGNIDMLEYTVKSAYRFLYKKAGLHKFEIAILNFIKQKLPHIINNEDLKQEFKELKDELEVIVKEPLQQKVLESFDFISWLESKIQNRPFAEVLREKIMNY